MNRSVGAIFPLAIALLSPTVAPAAELPALHATPSKPADPPREQGKGFDIPGSGLHVTFGGYIEGAVIATLPKNAASATARHHKPAF